MKVLRAERSQAVHRVHFKVGQRALDDYREKHGIVQTLAQRLTTSAGDLMHKSGTPDGRVAGGGQARRSS